MTRTFERYVSRGTCVTLYLLEDYDYWHVNAVVTIEGDPGPINLDMLPDGSGGYRTAFRISSDLSYGWHAVAVVFHLYSTPNDQSPSLFTEDSLILVTPAFFSPSQFWPVIPAPKPYPIPPLNLNRPFFPGRP